jgi:hypothetical protein
MINCYRFEKINFKNGLFDESVDATYILHLEGNGRIESIREQLLLYQPSKIVYILFNKGFTKCNKHDKINTTAIDIVDANMSVFEHAQTNKYNNVLILEDDCIFNMKIKEQNHANNINTFILKHQSERMIYLLGTLPILQMPYDINTNIAYSVGTHAVIYTKSIREQMLTRTIMDIDEYHNINSRKYIYYIPLCYQLFPDTENSANWGNDLGYLYKISVVSTAKTLFKYLKLDTQIEPGYTLFYKFSKIIFWILLLFIIFVIYYLITTNINEN